MSFVLGTPGPDHLTGTTEDDVIVADAGTDTLDGGEGSDTYLVGRHQGFDHYADAGAVGHDRIEATSHEMAIGLAGFGPASGIEEISSGGYVGVTLRGDVGDDLLDLSATRLVGIEAIEDDGGDDTIVGSAGDDVIAAGTGADVLDGGEGSDTYRVGRHQGFDTYVDRGVQGLDRIVATGPEMAIGLASGFGPAGGIEVIDAAGFTAVDIVAGERDDNLDFSATRLFGIRTIDAGGGADTVVGSLDLDDIRGGQGSDLLQAIGAGDALDGGDGADTLAAGDGGASLFGGRGADRLLGGAESDRLQGWEGGDDLLGGGGEDELLGGDGADTLQGGSGRDTLDGGAGDDRLVYDPDGGDQVDGGDGVDTLSYVSLDAAAVSFDAGRLADVTGIETFEVQTGAGDDLVAVGEGRDLVSTGAGADTLDGGAGDDRLEAGAGEDVVLAGAGDDDLVGGAGADTLSGGAGADLFRYAWRDQGGDRIVDFEHGVDRFHLEALGRPQGEVLVPLTFVAEQTDAVVAYGVTWQQVGGETIVRVDVTGDSTADLIIRLDGQVGLGAQDFLL